MINEMPCFHCGKRHQASKAEAEGHALIPLKECSTDAALPPPWMRSTIGDLTDIEIVDRINRALSLMTVNIASDPAGQPQYLSEFAMTSNDLLSRRAETQYEIVYPDTKSARDRTDKPDGLDKPLYAVLEDAIWQALDSEQGMPHSGVDPVYVIPEFLRLLDEAGYTITPKPGP